MARDFIKVDPTQSAATQAQALISYKNALRSALEQGIRLLAVLGHNNDGTVWTDVEAICGIPTGKGQTVFNFINGSVGAMQGTFQNADCKNFTETVG